MRPLSHLQLQPLVAVQAKVPSIVIDSLSNTNQSPLFSGKSASPLTFDFRAFHTSVYVIPISLISIEYTTLE